MRRLLAIAVLVLAPTSAFAEEIPGFTLDKVEPVDSELPAKFGDHLLDDHFVNRAECFRLTGQGTPTVCGQSSTSTAADASSSADTHDASATADTGDECEGDPECLAESEDASASGKPGKADEASPPAAFELTYSFTQQTSAELAIAVGTGCTVSDTGIAESATCVRVRQLDAISSFSGLEVEIDWADVLENCTTAGETFVWFGLVVPDPLTAVKRTYTTKLTIDRDYTPPVHPTIQPLEVGDQNLHVSWSDDKNDNETGLTYTVYWSTAEFTSANLPGSSKDELTGTSVQIAGLANNTEYLVGVVAVDQVGNESELCDAAQLEAGSPIVVDDFFEFYKKSGGREQGGYSCFVATAAWGSPVAPAVAWLRSFRDRHLLTNEGGTALVDLYYRVGPNAAHVIARHSWLRALARMLLWPLVLVVLAVAAWPVTGPIFAAAGAWTVRRVLRRKRETS